MIDVNTVVTGERNQAQFQVQVQAGQVGGWTVTKERHERLGNFLLNQPKKILAEGSQIFKVLRSAMDVSRVIRY